MVNKFNNRLIIYYGKSKYTNIYKRVINKKYGDRYEVITYFSDGKIDKYYKSGYVFNSEQIEELIYHYLHEFECEKSVIFN